MAITDLDTLGTHGAGFDHPVTGVDDLREALTDLQGLKFYAIAGGSAGDHTVTGVAADDHLVAVIHFTPSTSLAILTSEFTISAANTINNTGGTDTSSDYLLVVTFDKSGHA